MNTIPEFHLKNIIGIPALDLPVRRMESLFGSFDVLVLDPGSMVGWAGVTAAPDKAILVGQDHWHECLRWYSERVWIEETPFAARRTFDVWPIRYDGAVRAKLWPNVPNRVMPTDLTPAKQWFSLPRGHGLGRHAKDALTHLVGVLVRESR